MKRIPLIIGAVCIAVAALAVMFGPFKPKEQQEEKWNVIESKVPVDPRLVALHTDFALDLFHQMIRKADPGENVLLCPPSVVFALSMTYNGAAGQTQEAIGNTLRLNGMDTVELNKASSALLSNLNGLGMGVQLTFANALWGRKDVTFKPDFLKRCEGAYQARMTSLDFNSSAVDTINDWVKEKTKGRIDGIVEDISPEDFLVLTNTAYFRGIWADPFTEKATQESPFIYYDGTKKNVPMMNNYDAQVEEYSGKSFKAVSLAYGKGRVKMYVFLPNEDSDLANFYKNLNAKSWKKWMSGFKENVVSLYLPRFKTSFGMELNGVLKDLGMGPAFDPKKADLSGMCSIQPAWISEVEHKAFININEKGTEAAAVAKEIATAGMATPFMVNRPFFFAIRDDKTGEILFMGSIVDPTNEGS